MNRLLFWVVTILFFPAFFLGFFWSLASTYFFSGALAAKLELLGLAQDEENGE